jgi:hypothetical protein
VLCGRSSVSRYAVSAQTASVFEVAHCAALRRCSMAGSSVRLFVCLFVGHSVRALHCFRCFFFSSALSPCVCFSIVFFCCQRVFFPRALITRSGAEGPFDEHSLTRCVSLSVPALRSPSPISPLRVQRLSVCCCELCSEFPPLSSFHRTGLSPLRVSVLLIHPHPHPSPPLLPPSSVLIAVSPFPPLLSHAPLCCLPASAFLFLSRFVLLFCVCLFTAHIPHARRPPFFFASG